MSRHQLLAIAAGGTVLFASVRTAAAHGITDYLALEVLVSGPNCPCAPDGAPYDADIDGDLDLADVGSFQAVFVGPVLGGTAVGPCESPWRDPNDPYDPNDPFGCGDDIVMADVQGHTVHIVHSHALYNCCPLRFEHAAEFAGGMITVTEFEIVENPCPCLCCYELGTWIGDVPSGEYVLEFCWDDSWYGVWMCDQQTVIVP